jgi:hypothetical protein
MGCSYILRYVAILEGTCDSLINCSVFFCLKSKINTDACRVAESDSGITLKMGRSMPVLLCENVSNVEVGMCLGWEGNRN